MNHAWDHTDEADVILLGPLNVLHPHLKNLDEEAAAAEFERIASVPGPRPSNSPPYTSSVNAGVEGIVELVVRGAVPEPGHHAQRLEAELHHCPLEFPHGLHRALEVHGRDADEAAREPSHDVGDVVVADDPPLGATPGASTTPSL